MSRLPVLSLDDFYRDGTDPDMPRHPDLGIVDWDDPRAWNTPVALDAVTRICREGAADIPVYDMSQDRAVRTQRFSAGESAVFVAEGLFAGELIDGCKERGILADAIVVSRSPWKNFARRLGRDLVERRKPPLTLLRRGRALMAAERDVVARQVALGCRPCDATDVYEALATARARFS
jgi:uridine kinase